MPVGEMSFSPDEEKHDQCNHHDDDCSNLVVLPLWHKIIFPDDTSWTWTGRPTQTLLSQLFSKTMPPSIGENL